MFTRVLFLTSRLSVLFLGSDVLISLDSRANENDVFNYFPIAQKFPCYNVMMLI